MLSWLQLGLIWGRTVGREDGLPYSCGGSPISHVRGTWKLCIQVFPRWLSPPVSCCDSTGAWQSLLCDWSALPCLRAMCFFQLGRSVGPALLQSLLGLLKQLVIHAERLDAQNQQKLEAARAESDLFLDMESVASLELATDKVFPSPTRPVSLFPQAFRYWLFLSCMFTVGNREM